MQNLIKNIIALREKALQFIDVKQENSIKTSDFKKNLMILSSSRSGSSLLFQLLSKNKQVVTLDGETTPYLNLFVKDKESDQLTVDDAVSFLDNENDLVKDMLYDMGSVIPDEYLLNHLLNKENASKYCVDVLRRLIIQWPLKDWNIEGNYFEILDILSSCTNTCEHFDIESFYKNILKFYKLDSRYYDFQSQYMEETIPPLEHQLIEEFPYIFVRPKLQLTRKDLNNKYLLMKTPSNVYRISFWKKIFCNTHWSWIHLKRNPAASINGLIDGWTGSGFYSHKTSVNLSISGYSEKYKWGSNWWCFDLFPGWSSSYNDCLAILCSKQWLYAHSNIYNLNLPERDTFDVMFEDLIGLNKINVLNNLCNFFELNSFEKSFSFPVVQSTSKPKLFKWLSKKDIIIPIINQNDVMNMAVKLGYSKNYLKEWS